MKWNPVDRMFLLALGLTIAVFIAAGVLISLRASTPLPLFAVRGVVAGLEIPVHRIIHDELAATCAAANGVLDMREEKAHFQGSPIVQLTWLCWRAM